MAVTSYGRNKNHDDEIKKNQEKANNSLSYRCAAIKKIHVEISSDFRKVSNFNKQQTEVETIPLERPVAAVIC